MPNACVQLYITITYMHYIILYYTSSIHYTSPFSQVVTGMVLVLDWSSDGSYHFESDKSLGGIWSINWRVLWLMEINSFGWKALHDINLSYLTDGASYIYCY